MFSVTVAGPAGSAGGQGCGGPGQMGIRYLKTEPVLCGQAIMHPNKTVHCANFSFLNVSIKGNSV